MNLTSFPYIFAKLLTLLFLLSCSGGGIGSGALYAGGGIGGTGFTLGQITAFGSVLVNDIEFDLNEAGITVNGDPASELDLRIGMIVKLKGQFEADGISGTADSIVYEKDLQGPVSNIKVVDDQTKELLVLGQTVVIGRSRTRFDEPFISFDTVANGNVIEVSGFVDSGAGYRATWIKLADSPDEFEVEGVIRDLDEANETFKINELVVDYRNADTSELSGGVPQDGQFVSAMGQDIDPSGKLDADVVVPEDIQPQALEGDLGEIEGFITTVYPSIEFELEFELARWLIGADGRTVFENGSPADILPDKRVEVEGKVNAAGVLVADRVIFQTDYTEDYATAVAQGPNGNIYVTGYTKGQSTDFDYSTIKYDADGNFVWVRRYDAGYFNEDRATAIAVDDDGYIYVTGYAKTNGNDFDFLTLKYNPAGNIEWTRTYDFGIGDEDVATAIALDNVGNAYVAGYSKTNDSDFDYVIVSYDPSGNGMLFASHDGAGMEDKAQGVAVDDAGKVYVTGFSKTNDNDFDFLTVSYLPSGNELWAQTYDLGIGDVDVATAIALDSAGNAYVTGYSKTNGNDFDYVIVRYDPFGIVNFFAGYDAVGMEDKARGITLDNSGNVYVTGSSKDPDTDFDYLTIKYNDSGNLQWDVRYDGAAMEDAAQAITWHNQGYLIVAGYSKGKYSDYDFTTIMYEEVAENSARIKWIDRYDGSY